MNNNFPYPMGSLWRRWDLQTQTILDDAYVPLTQYANDLKQQNLGRWQEYAVKVGGEENALLYDSKEYFNNGSVGKRERCINYVRNFFAFLETFNPALACLGITDHNYFDDTLLDVFIEYADGARLKIIPGVEINCNGIHLLLYFPHALYGKKTFSAGIHAFLLKLNINNRTTNGVLTTTTCDIKHVIDETRRNEGILIYPHCNSDNGLFQERTRTDRVLLADIFNHQRVNLLQSQNHDATLEVAKYIRSKDTFKSKFCTHISSDARSLRDYGRPDKDGNYLWIKSDPTFEGLRQIIYEAEQRIFVGPQRPGGKRSYFVIERARFLDNTANQRFGSDAIEINKNLTTIVGGKSTGKSLLLYYMAKTIDRKEVTDRIAATSNTANYDCDADPDFNFEITWEDGQRTLLKVPESIAEDGAHQRKILYIPQRYLNALSETNIKSREALNEFVLAVILQDPASARVYEAALREIRALSKSINVDIGQLFADREDIEKTEEDLKQTGDEQGIEIYVKRLQAEADAIKEKSGLSEGEIKEYEDLTARENLVNTHIANLEADKKAIEDLAIELSSQIGAVQSAIGEYEAYLTDSDIKAKVKTEFGVVDIFATSLEAAANNVRLAIAAKLKDNDSELIAIRASLTPLLSKVHLQTELEQKATAIATEQRKLDDVRIQRNGLKTKREAYEKKITSIVESYKKIVGHYENLTNELKKFESKFGEIALQVHVSFDNERFGSEVVDEYLNRNDLKRNIEETEWGKEFVYKYDSSKHATNIDKVLRGVLDGKINMLRRRAAREMMSLKML